MSALLKTKEQIYTPEEYLELEAKAEFRSEFESGWIIEMSGATEQHIDISFNVTAQINQKLRGKCRGYQSEMKVWVEKTLSFYYPDITVVCGDRNYYQNRRDVITNPILLVEVLSKSTEAKDRGEKFFAYQTLESLQEYVLISLDKYVVEQYIKQKDRNWLYKATIGQDSQIKLHSVNETLKLSEIYDLVEFEEEG